jgi:4,5-DOPA dioxygenase extradiol
MSGPLAPDVPAGAYEGLRPALEAASRAQRSWTPADGALPALYVSHAPPLLDDTEWMTDLARWALRLPKPRGVLIVSAHWESAPLMLSSPAAGTPLVYDFGGFHRAYYALTYPTPEAGELARRVAAAMPDAEAVHTSPSRGLDHGAWVPLMVMYPLADVPVLQLSIPTHDPARLLDLGRRLRLLRQEGVLVVGSGFMTHGLPFITRDALDGAVPSWSADFDAWAAEALATGDVETLAAYRSKAPGMPFAHPTVEHFVPIFLTLGAATDPEAPVTTAVDGFFIGLAKRSFQVA